MPDILMSTAYIRQACNQRINIINTHNKWPVKFSIIVIPKSYLTSLPMGNVKGEVREQAILMINGGWWPNLSSYWMTWKHHLISLNKNLKAWYLRYFSTLVLLDPLHKLGQLEHWKPLIIFPIRRKNISKR